MRIKPLRQDMENAALWLRHTEENGAVSNISDPLRVMLMNLAQDIQRECKKEERDGKRSKRTERV